MLEQPRRDGFRECVAIDGKSSSGGETVAVGRLYDQPASLPHFPVKKTDRVVLVVIGPEGVRADHFGIIAGLMGKGARARSHFVQDHRNPLFGGLPGGFGASQPAADDMKWSTHWGDVAPGGGIEKGSVGLGVSQIFAKAGDRDAAA